MKPKSKAVQKIVAGILIFFFALTGIFENAVGVDLKKAFALPGSFLPVAGALGDLQSQASVAKPFHTDLFTGSAQFAIPVFTPPGRKGIAPEVAIGYSSSGGNSWLGVGWNLGNEYIQRSTKRGVPTYQDNQDTFDLMVKGVQSELVKISSTEYHARYESGEFMKIVFQNDFWKVTDKSGTQYFFGQTEQAKDRNSLGIFSWQLEKVRDVSGNTITYTYTKDQGELYPSRIDYNGNEDENFAPTHSVEFVTEAKPDITFSYITGVKVSNARRLKEILVKVNGALARKYLLTYEQSPVVGRSRLKTAKECGTDGTSCLPPTTFTYQEQTFGFKPGVIWNQPNLTLRTIANGLNTETSSTDDIDGDGFPDRLLKLDSLCTQQLCQWQAFKNTGAGFELAPSLRGPIQGWADQSYAAIRGDSNGTSSYVNLIDINRDGKLDRVVQGTSNNVGGGNGWALQINNGIGFENQIYFGPTMENTQLRTGQWYHPDGFDPDTYRVLWDATDMNSDGFVDRLATVNNNTWGVYWGSGTGFSSVVYNWNNVQGTPNWNSVRDYDSDTGHGSSDLMDINGDDLPDRIIGGGVWNPGGSTGFAIQYNNGRSFENLQYLGILPSGTTSGVTMDIDGGSHSHPNTTHILLDVNQDGLPDRVRKISNTQWNVHFNTGNGFVTSGVAWGPIEGFSDSDKTVRRTEGDSVTVDYFDIDADGFPDRIVSHPSEAKWMVQLAYETVPDLLRQVNNGRGGVTTVTYKPATRYYNGGGDGIADLSFPLMTVESVTQDDGFGNLITTQYEYADGKYNAAEREFRGFNRARVIDADGNYTDTWFYQSNPLKGRPYLTETRDVGQNFYSQTWNEWQTIEPAGMSGVEYARVISTTNWIYDGNETFKFGQMNYLYDQYGNVIETLNWGEIEPDGWNQFTGDEIRTKIQYAYNTALWIMDKPKHVETYDKDWNRLQESWLYYDSNLNFHTPPTRGLLTKKEELIALGGAKVKTEMTYDPFGNLLTVKDAKGFVTTNEYDPTFKLYLTKVTNTLGHAQEFTYDPLIAQITHVKDQNNQISRTIYDPLGRAVKVISPLDSDSAPTRATFYDLSVFPNRMVSYVKIDSDAPALSIDGNPHAGYLTSYSFSDGLGREIQKRSPAEASNQQVVSGLVTYDSRGQVKRQYVPYYADFRTTYATPPTNFPYAEFDYDAVGRRIKTTYPDGAFATIQFDDFTKVLTDPNGHEKRYTQDAYGNLIKVEEFNQSQTYTTRYEYDRLNRLIKTTDHYGHVTEVEYDMLGRKTAMADPNMGIWAYTYDANNNLLTQTDAKSQTITFQYDNLNRLTRKTYPDGTHIDYTYDFCPLEACGWQPESNVSVGKLVKVSDQSGIQTFRYDQLGRVIQDKKSLDNGEDYTFTRIYDPQGRVTSLEYPDQDILNLTFNNMGEAETLTLIPYSLPLVSIIQNVNYNPSGQITKIEFGNGVVSDYTYNLQTLRLERLLTQNQAQVTLQDFTYEFDNAGNVQSITDAVNTNTQSFLYDDLDRLTQATGNYGTHIFEYNAIGNMTRKHNAYLNYTDPAHPHAVTRYQKGAEVIQYQYDANGNMTKRGSDTILYDFDNRPIRMDRTTTTGGCDVYPVPMDYYQTTQSPGTGDDGNALQAPSPQPVAGSPGLVARSQQPEAESVAQGNRSTQIMYPCPNPGQTTTHMFAQYVYDASGQRVKKITDNKIEYYLGKDYELNYTSDPVGMGSFSTRKAFFLGEARIAEFEQIQNAEGVPPHIRFFHGDHLGSTNIITNEQGNQTLLMEYLPYGEVKLRVGTDPVQNTFTGQKEDLESGLMYYNARYYDPKIGRFIQADSIVPNATDPQEFNRYSYVNNNPIKFTDPTGHKKKKWWKKLFKRKSTKGGLFGAIIGGIVGSIVPGIGTVAGASIGGAIGGGIGGGIDAAQAGGNFGQIVRGVVSGAVEGYLIGQVIGNVTVGVGQWLAAMKNPAAGFGHYGINANDVLAKYGGRVHINGMGVPYEQALADANSLDAALFYNPSNGFIADLTESALQKFTGTSSLGRGLRHALGPYVARGGEATIFAHSQGALIASNAVTSSLLGGSSLRGVAIESLGGAANSFTAKLFARAAGATFNSISTPNDIVAALAQPELNPIKFTRAMVGGIASGGRDHDFRHYLEIKRG